MSYNHDTFIEQLMTLDSENQQLEVLKEYMLKLPTSEFDAFLFGNLDKLDLGLQELMLSKDFTKTQQSDLEHGIDTLIERILSTKQDLNFEKRKAA